MYLDCKLLTNSGTLFTNKCILKTCSIMKGILNGDCEGEIIISMPEYSKSDLDKKLWGHLTTEKKNFVYATSFHQPQPLSSETVPSKTPICKDNFSPSIFLPQKLNSIQDRKEDRSLSEQSKSTKFKIAEKVFQCHICGKTFTTSKKIRMHRYQVHRSEGTFNCELCGSTFKTKSTLSNHLSWSHGDPSFECEFCSKVCL